MIFVVVLGVWYHFEGKLESAFLSFRCKLSDRECREENIESSELRRMIFSLFQECWFEVMDQPGGEFPNVTSREGLKLLYHVVLLA